MSFVRTLSRFRNFRVLLQFPLHLEEVSEDKRDARSPSFSSVQLFAGLARFRDETLASHHGPH
jgi:hypothetical protein